METTLFDKINNIISQLPENLTPEKLSFISDTIMMLIRNESRYIDRKIVGKYYGDLAATLNPNDLECDFDNHSDLPLYDHIFANSFGPFNASEYFKSSTKIIWLLKESFITAYSWQYGDRGGHNQADEYIKYYDKYSEFGNPTIDNVLKLTKEILTSAGIIQSETSDKDVMNHICILEVNHFPGLALNLTKSKDDLIGEWAVLNAELVKQLLSFYSPNIVIGGFTLGHFFPEGYRYKTSIGKNNKHGFPHIEKGISQNINMLETLGYTTSKDKKNTAESGNFLFESKEGCIFIDANHPCIASNYKIDQATKEGEIIRTLKS